MRTLSILIGRMSHASQTGIMLAPLHYRSLPRLHVQAVAHYSHGRNVLIPFTFQAQADPKWWVSESNHLNSCPIRHPPTDVTLWTDAFKKGWSGGGGSITGNIYWGPLDCRRGEGAHQCLGVTGHHLRPQSTSKACATCTQTYPLTGRQHTCSGLHKQEGEDTLPYSDFSGLGTVGSCPGSGSVLDRTAY